MEVVFRFILVALIKSAEPNWPFKSFFVRIYLLPNILEGFHRDNAEAHDKDIRPENKHSGAHRRGAIRDFQLNPSPHLWLLSI